VATSAELGQNYGAALQAIILGKKSAKQAMDEIRPNVEQQLTLILAELQGLKGITEYV